MSKVLEGMAQLGQMILDSDLTELKQTSEQIEALRAKIRDLDGEVRRRSQAAAHSQDVDLALSSGRDAIWLNWVDTRKAALMRQIAQLAAQREDQLAVARKAFGRAQAIDALKNRAQEARLQALARRQ